MASQENDDEIQRFLPFLLWTRHTHSDSVPSQCWKYCSLALSQPFLHMCSLAWSSLALKFFLVLSSLQLVSAWCFITCNGDGTCEFLVAGGWRSRSEEGIDTRERWWWWSSWCRGVYFKLVWVCDQWVSEFVWRCDNLSSILFGDGFVEADLLLLWCS